MNDLKVKAAIYEDVYINPAEVMKRIKETLGLANGRDTFVCERDGQLMRGVDVSRHGSPQYEYTLISDNPNWIALYNSVNCLEDYFMNASEAKWQRVIDNETDENESPVFSM